MSPEKQKLLELEKTDLYVFHGSESEVEEFEPLDGYIFLIAIFLPNGSQEVLNM